MNGLLTEIARAQEGVFTTADAVRCGYDSNTLRTLIRLGECRRLARGVYDTARPRQRPTEEHLLLTTAMLLRYGGRAVASHVSAVVLHNLPTYRVDLSRAHLTAVAGATGRRVGAVVLHRPLPGLVVGQVGRWPVAAPAVALVQLAATAPAASAVVSIDAALNRRMVSAADLAAARRQLARHPGIAAVDAVLDAADPRSESPGESLTRLGLALRGIPVVPQARIDDPAGQFVARVDLQVRGTMVVVEFDGLVKYRGTGGEEALIAEKLREDQLRELGYTVIRLTWTDLADLDGVARRVRQAVVRARPAA